MKRIINYKPTLGEAALLMLENVAGATLKTLYPHPYYHLFCHHTQRRSFSNALKRMERRHLIGIKVKNGEEAWYLTPTGEQLVRRLKMKIHQDSGKRWDKKWRLILFDIPEKVRERRDFLRKELHALGFLQLQKSVWVSPYSLPAGFDEIVSELELGKNFRVAVVESIDNDRDLRELFFPRA